MKSISICSATDLNYSIPLAVCISSICINNKDKEINYYIFSNNLPKSEIKRFLDLEVKYENLRIKILDTTFRQLPERVQACMEETLKNGSLSISSYSRLFMLDLLPKNLERVLYLDCDVICQQDLESLWATDMSGYVVAGVIDNYESLGKKRLQLTHYINSGVLFINLKLWREFKCTDKCLSVIEKKAELIKLHDQDVINIALEQNILEIDLRWNWQVRWLDRSKKKLAEIRKNAVLLHYVSYKPWIKGNLNPLEDVWFKYWKEYADGESLKMKKLPLLNRVFMRVSLCSFTFFPAGSTQRNFLVSLLPRSFIEKVRMLYSPYR